MRNSPRVMGLCFALVLGCGAAAHPLLCGDPGAINFDSEPGRAEELEQQRARVALRVETKQRLVDDLIDDRLSLPVVAEKFLALNREPPETASSTHLYFPGGNEYQRTAHQVLNHVRLQLRTRHDLTPGQRDRVLQRVESQLREMSK